MIVVKYPNYGTIRCDKCGSEFTLNRRDYRKRGILSSTTGALICNCPVCKNRILLRENSIEQVIFEDILTLFKARALEVNQMPATENRREVAQQLNKLHRNVLEYFKDKYELEEVDNEDN